MSTEPAISPMGSPLVVVKRSARRSRLAAAVVEVTAAAGMRGRFREAALEHGVEVDLDAVQRLADRTDPVVGDREPAFAQRRERDLVGILGGGLFDKEPLALVNRILRLGLDDQVAALAQE